VSVSVAVAVAVAVELTSWAEWEKMICLLVLVCENKSQHKGKKNGNKMCEERLTLSIYTPGKIKQVSKEKKDHTQVKNDSSELFTVLIIHDSNM
jgi:hypothetical protein